jgi:hypothetical protein
MGLLGHPAGLQDQRPACNLSLDSNNRHCLFLPYRLFAFWTSQQHAFNTSLFLFVQNDITGAEKWLDGFTDRAPAVIRRSRGTQPRRDPAFTCATPYF